MVGLVTLVCVGGFSCSVLSDCCVLVFVCCCLLFGIVCDLCFNSVVISYRRCIYCDYLCLIVCC